MRTLGAAAGKPVALIIDEAQQALTTREGENTMMALKSARDQLNTPDETKLLLIMSGSDRDKLLRLLNSYAAPFFGSSISRMPELGEDFIAYIAGLIQQSYPQLTPVDASKLWTAFQHFSHRPEPFLQMLSELLNPMHTPCPGFEDEALASAERQRLQDEKQMSTGYLALNETGMHAWFDKLSAAGQWPPR